jgi:hypothetical protein
MAATDEEIQDIVKGMHDGTLTKKLKTNIGSITGGLIIGGAFGFFAAGLTGGCKFCMTFWGAVGGSAAGYLRGK